MIDFTQNRINLLHLRLRTAQFAYFALGQSPWTDAEFDRMVYDLRQLDSNHPFLSRVGARHSALSKDLGKEVRLPVSMGSLDKLRPGEMKKWARALPPEHRKRPFIVLPKIDGLSLLLCYDEHGKLYQAITRGDGVTGRDVTALIKNNTTIPKFVPIRSRKSYVRGEFVLTKDCFAMLQRAAMEANKDGKKTTEYRNARNMLVGCLNTKTQTPIHYEALKQATFLALNIQFEPHTTKRPCAEIPMGASKVRADKAPKSVRLKYLSKAGFTIPHVQYAPFEHVKIWKGKVRQYIKDGARKLHYDIDGVVISSDAENAEKIGFEANGLNPRWERAVKLDLTDQNSQTVEVSRVVWSMSPRGLYKPVVQLKYDANFNGVRVRNVNADNAGYVKKNGLGPGAVVTIVRSGDVIPRIVRVETPSGEEGHFPTVCKKHGEKLKWTPTKTDLFCPICAGQLNSPADFFKVLSPDNIGHTLVQKAVDILKVDTIKQLLEHMDALRGEDGFGSKRSRMFKESLTSALATASLPKLMHASGAFRSTTIGLGEARISAILDHVRAGKAFDMVRKGKIDALSDKARGAEGVGRQAADCFARQLPNFLELWDSIQEHAARAKQDLAGKAKSGKLKGKRYAFTSFRSKTLETLITDNGGIVTNTINEKLTALFVPSTAATSVKIEKARKAGIRMITADRAVPYLEKRVGTAHKTEVKAGRPQYKFKNKGDK